MADVKQLSATGDVTTQDVHLQAVTLTAGSDAATLAVREGGSGGTVVLTLKAAANTTTHAYLGEDVSVDGGVHATFTGTGPVGSFVTE